MRIILCSVLLVWLSHQVNAQVVNTATMDTTDFNHIGKIAIGGYVDGYYGYDFNRPPSGDRPYFVSMARHNEFNINLAYVDIKYAASRLRARFVPAFGTYMNSNYAAEPAGLRNILEASVGVKIFQDKDIWLDAGVIGSPYTNESAISKDHLMYTRSMGAENVPYYLSGIKVSAPINKKMNFYFYLINGWQQIHDQNSGKSIGTQIEYRPNLHWLINWNTYLGDERSDRNPQNRTRYFSDVFFIYSKGRFSATGCLYGGAQNQYIANASNQTNTWWQANLVGRYNLNSKWSLSGRVEYFRDPSSVMVTSITNVQGFDTYGTGFCLNRQIAPNAMFRFEGRALYSDKEVYLKDARPSKTSSLLITNMTIWF